MKQNCNCSITFCPFMLIKSYKRTHDVGTPSVGAIGYIQLFMLFFFENKRYSYLSPRFQFGPLQAARRSPA